VSERRFGCSEPHFPLSLIMAYVVQDRTGYAVQ
jgi:hypothetical protein